MSKHAEVVIIGAGLIGVSIAYHLAIRGCTDVLILEKQHRAAGNSTARALAGVRHQFHTPVNVQLALYSTQRLADFEREIGVSSGLHQTGSLCLINDSATWQDALHALEMQRALGAHVVALSPTESTYLLPHLHTADLVGATYSPNGGTYDARSVALGYLQRALELGVRLRRRSAVVGFEIRHEQVYAVHTHTNTIACNVVVNAAGPWAGQVAAYAGLELPVRPHSQSIYAAAPIAHIPPTAPMVVDVASGFFLRRSDDGLFLGRYRDDVPADVLADVDWDGFDEVLAAGRHRLPPLQQISLNHDRCRVGLCEQTPDASPVLGRHPDVPSYIDASGFSDHSVMSAPAAGMLIAEEILDGRAHTIDIDDLRVGRFLSVLRQKEHGAI